MTFAKKRAVEGLAFEELGVNSLPLPTERLLVGEEP
jgi:hypothetical protein